MDNRVARLINEKKAERIKAAEDKRNKRLISLGLFEKVYSPDGKYSDEYCFSEWDEEAKAHKCYKKVPIPVTNEEYALINEYIPENGRTGEHSALSHAIGGIGWFFLIVGTVVGIIAMMGDGLSGIITIASSVISGVMFLGFSRIIQLLEDIKAQAEQGK